MKLNIVLNGCEPELVKERVAETFTSCNVEIVEQYDNVSVDINVTPPEEGQYACSLEGLRELTYYFKGWDIRIY